MTGSGFSLNSLTPHSRRFSVLHAAIALLFTLLTCGGFAQSSPDSCLPSTAGVQICLPESAGTVGSVVTIIAGAVAQSGNIAAISAYIDDAPVFTVDNSAATNSFQVAQDVNVDAGNRHLVVVGYQDDGGTVIADTFFNSATATFANCIPDAPGAMFCHPGIARTISPIQISAGVTALNGYITAIRLYVDDVPQLTVDNPQPTQSFAINEPLVVSHLLDPSTAHNLILVGYDRTGGAVTASHALGQVSSFNVPRACQAPDSPGVNVCSPQPGSCTTSGLYWIHATGTGATGAVDHMELWTDAGKIADFPGNSINTNIGPPLAGGGPLNLTIVVVDSNGQTVSSAPITVFAC